MKIGLLVCDEVKKEFLSINGTYQDMFVDLFPEFQFIVYKICDGQYPDSPKDCDAWMTTGSKYSAYDHEDWIIWLQTFIKAIYEIERPFVGVCFGHQVLAEALGGKVTKAPNGWSVGVHEFTILKEKSWMHPYAPKIQLIMMCQDQVLLLPPNSQWLAQSDQCPHGIFLVGNTMLGIQAHPEFSKSYNQALIEARIGKIGTEKAKLGMQSLQKSSVDRKMIANWIIQFIELTVNQDH